MTHKKENKKLYPTILPYHTLSYIAVDALTSTKESSKKGGTH